jgi:hypothetical protein
VSLLLRDRLIVGLAPECLTALRIGGIWHPKILERYELALPTADPNHWDEVIAALEILLEQPKWAACNLTVILSSHFVQYLVVPKGEGLSAQKQNDLARLIFRNVFGELSHDWELRSSPSAKQATLASGVPMPLLAALHAACEGRGFLRSVQPGLMPIFNRLRTQIRHESGILALVESGRISLAMISNGQWASIISRAGEGSALRQFLEEDSLRQGHRPGGLLWLCDLTGEVLFSVVDSPWQVQPLKPLHLRPDSIPGLADWGVP